MLGIPSSVNKSAKADWILPTDRSHKVNSNSLKCTGNVAMSKKVSSKALQADYSIKPNELAFLVREYLKSIGCNNALAAFMSEHPEASKVQAPVRTNDPFYSLIGQVSAIGACICPLFQA